MNENEIRVHVVDEPDRTNLSMRYLDPVTGRQSKRSTGTTDLKEARKKAAQWEADLNEGRYHAPLKTTWDQFRDRYQAEHLATLAEGTQDRAALALNMYEEYMRPRLLSDVTASRISTFQSRL